MVLKLAGWLLILILLFQPPDPAPQDVRLEWAGPASARISWTHPNAGNYWAVYRMGPWGWRTIEESFDVEPGKISVALPDAHPGAHYLIQLAQKDPGATRQCGASSTGRTRSRTGRGPGRCCR